MTTIKVTPKTAMQRIAEKTTADMNEEQMAMEKWFDDERRILRENPNLKKKLGRTVLWEYDLLLEERRQGWF